jgi:hypothetical protein
VSACPQSAAAGLPPSAAISRAGLGNGTASAGERLRRADAGAHPMAHPRGDGLGPGVPTAGEPRRGVGAARRAVAGVGADGEHDAIGVAPRNEDSGGERPGEAAKRIVGAGDANGMAHSCCGDDAVAAAISASVVSHAPSGRHEGVVHTCEAASRQLLCPHEHQPAFLARTRPLSNAYSYPALKEAGSGEALHAAGALSRRAAPGLSEKRRGATRTSTCAGVARQIHAGNAVQAPCGAHHLVRSGTRPQAHASRRVAVAAHRHRQPLASAASRARRVSAGVRARRPRRCMRREGGATHVPIATSSRYQGPAVLAGVSSDTGCVGSAGARSPKRAALRAESSSEHCCERRRRQRNAAETRIRRASAASACEEAGVPRWGAAAAPSARRSGAAATPAGAERPAQQRRRWRARASAPSPAAARHGGVRPRRHSSRTERAQEEESFSLGARLALGPHLRKRFLPATPRARSSYASTLRAPSQTPCVAALQMQASLLRAPCAAPRCARGSAPQPAAAPPLARARLPPATVCCSCSAATCWPRQLRLRP